MTERHCVTLAGGLGKRLSAVTNDLIPKALTPVNGRPFLDYKILSLLKMGVTHIWILVGKHGDQIESYVAKHQFDDVAIHILHDGDFLRGTAGAITHNIKFLPERFWVTYADTFVMAPLALAEDHFDPQGLRTMCVLQNRDQIETSNIKVAEGKVVMYSKDEPPGTFEWIDYGLLRLFRQDFDAISQSQPVDLSSVIKELISEQLLGAWAVEKPFWEIGTPTSKLRTENYFMTQDWSKFLE